MSSCGVIQIPVFFGSRPGGFQIRGRRAGGVPKNGEKGMPTFEGMRRMARGAKETPNRADRIRTCDLLNPIQAHYQAVLRPVSDWES